MRRSDRLIRVTKWLMDRPNTPVSLSDLSEHMGAAKSSLSEDVSMIRDVLVTEGLGNIVTIPGAAGGVQYRVEVPRQVATRLVLQMRDRLTDASRVLPGGFLYMSDLLGDPDVLDFAGRWFAERFAKDAVDVVVTIETKGIPLAVATAHYLHVPVVIVRREHRVTDGSVVSVHYVSGSTRRIQTMSISKRAMPNQARALIVDDFMRAGATAKAVSNLISEFDAMVVGTAIFAVTAEPTEKLVSDYVALFSLDAVEEGERVTVTPLTDTYPDDIGASK